jgi:RNA polymerase sigma-70 factor, ECF subfamily
VDGAEDFVLAQARAGNRDAFRTLVERHSRAVFRVAFRIMGNEQDA